MSKNKTLNIIPTKNQLGKYYLILAALVFIVYGNTLFNGYNLDDHLVTQNHKYTSKGLSAIKDIITSDYYSNNVDINFGYRPIVHISFAIEHQLFGEHASISHLINLLIYFISVCLFFKLCLKWFGEKNTHAALLTALIFAVHPLHTEAVASIKNRDELLALLFGLLSIYTFIKYAHNSAVKWLVCGFIAFALGMLSKKSIYPLAIITPATILTLNNSTFKNTLLIAIVMSVPGAIIGSDLQIYRGVILFLIPFLGLMFTHVILNFTNYTSNVKSYISSFPIRTLSIIISLSTFALGCALKEIAIITLSIAFTGLSLKTNRTISILILALQITIIAFQYEIKEFHKYAIVLGIACIIQVVSLSERKKPDYVWLGLAFLPLMAYLSIHKNWISTNVFFEIALYFILLYKKSIWGLAFIIFSMSLSAVFFETSTFHYLLTGYTILRVLNDYHLFGKLNFEKPLVKLSIMVVVMLVIFSANPIHSALLEKLDQQYHRFNTEYLNTNQEQNTGNEGRRINYIENTLAEKYTRAELLATGFASIAEYGRLTLFPSELSFYYGYAKIKTVNFSDKNAWLGLIILLVSVAIALWYFKRSILISIGIVWYILSIALFSNWFEPVAGMVGERLAYTASVGFCLAFAAFVLWLKPNFSLLKPKGLELVVIVFLGLLSFRSISRNNDWADPITLMEHDIEHLENSAQAHNLLALNLMYVSSNNKNLSPQQVIEMQNKAAVHLQKSTEIYPYFFNTNFDLARIYINLGDLIKARESLDQALKIDPNNLFALEEMAKTCYELKLVDDTERYANKYLAQIPQNENMHEILIYNMLANGRLESAIYYAERAMSYYPNNQIIQKMYKDAQNMLGASKPKNQ